MANIVYTITECLVCGSPDLCEAIHLPKLPLSGTYAPPSKPKDYQGYDLRLALCNHCNHLQLVDHLDPKFVYTNEDYHFRGGRSCDADSRMNFFINFLTKHLGNKKFNCILDVGCNDLFLLRKMKHLAKSLVGLDPIWADRNGEVTEDGILLLGKSVEGLNDNDLPEKPDLIISTHTLEHLSNPKGVLSKLLKISTENAVFAIEVPNFEILQERLRFDQLFHQHIHYFTENSISRLVTELGCNILAKKQSIIHWGSLLFLFSKTSSTSALPNKLWNKSTTFDQIKKDFRSFSLQNERVGRIIEKSKPSADLYGYGAALMLPVIAYHWKNDLSGLQYVYDDDPEKNRFTYSNLDLEIRNPSDETFDGNCRIIITAVDNFTSIFNRLKHRNIKQIINPLISI